MVARRVARRPITIDDYDRMIAAGILHEDERVELLEGEIVCMAAIGLTHSNVVSFLIRWFARRLPESAHVRAQDPIRLPPGSEPQPDLTIVRSATGTHLRMLPGPEDILLLIEVADTSLAYDRDVKLPLYAAAGIAEVWIVDLAGERVLVNRAPRRGRYARRTTVARGGVLTSAAFPALALDELLGPRP